MRNEYLTLAQDLIRCRPVSSDIAGVNRACDVLKSFLDARNIFNVVELIGQRKVLYASTCREKVCDYLLNGHIDVVPAAYPEQFEPFVKDGRLYGRGAIDDLGNAVLAVQLLCENIASGASLGVIFTADEEIGGSTTKGMVELGYGAGKCVVVLDSWASGGINIAQKGILSLKLTARGDGGHSSVPWAGVNPIDRLMNGYMKFAQSWVNPDAGDQWHDTMAATQLNAGFAHNQIPDTAEMVVNFRCISEESMREILQRITEVTGLEVEVVESCLPVVSDPGSSELQRLLKILSEERRIDAEYHRMNGATDARHFGKLGVPVAIMGMLGGGVHAGNEYLDLSTYQPTLKALQRFISEK